MRRDWRTWALVAIGLGVVGVVALELKRQADRARETRRRIAEGDEGVMTHDLDEEHHSGPVAECAECRGECEECR